MWETRFTGSLQRPVFAFPYAIQGFVQSGAMIVVYEDVLLLGRDGGPRTHLGSALAIAGVESPLAVLSSVRARCRPRRRSAFSTWIRMPLALRSRARIVQQYFRVT